MRRLGLLVASACLSACTAAPWESYDQTSYAAVMDPSARSVESHIEVLERWADGPDAAVPPGIYAELGYWLAKVGRTEEARTMFEREMARYPYAEKYLRMLMALVLPVVPKELKP